MDQREKLEVLKKVRATLLPQDISDAADFFSMYSPAMRKGENINTYYQCTPTAALARGFRDYTDHLKVLLDRDERAVEGCGPVPATEPLRLHVMKFPDRVKVDLDEVGSTVFATPGEHLLAEIHHDHLHNYNYMLRNEGAKLVAQVNDLLPTPKLLCR